MSHAHQFWNRVKQLLKEKKFTQKDAAAACSVSLRTFQHWIYRDLYPTIVDGFFLARFLGVSVEYLVTGKDRRGKDRIDTVRSLLKEADHNLLKIWN